VIGKNLKWLKALTMVKKYFDVVVSIIKGTGLFAADSNGKSDPLVKLQCNAEHYKTAVVEKTCDPVWNEKWVLTDEITSGTKITMEVYDQDMLINDYLGNAEYIFTDHEENAKLREQVVDVTLKGKKEGTLTLGIFVKQYTYDVDVTFVKGNGLKSADLFSKSDPYIKATLAGQSYETAVINNTLDPEWGEKWTVQNVPGPNKLEFEVFDKDVFPKKDDFLGRGSVVISSDEALGAKKTATVTLKDEQDKESGTVVLDLAFKIHGKK